MFPSESARADVRPSAAEINEQLRAHSTGRVVWTAEARREWRRLTAEWAAAVEREHLVRAA